MKGQPHPRLGPPFESLAQLPPRELRVTRQGVVRSEGHESAPVLSPPVPVDGPLPAQCCTGGAAQPAGRACDAPRSRSGRDDATQMRSELGLEDAREADGLTLARGGALVVSLFTARISW